MREQEIRDKLNQFYPSGEVASLTTKHRALYEAIKAKAKGKMISVPQLLGEWGFTYNFGGLPFDPDIAYRLNKEFGLRYQRFAEWTGYSKQMISIRMNAYESSEPNPEYEIGSWLGTNLTGKAYDIAHDMIASKKFDLTKDGIRTILGNDGAGKVYLVVICQASIIVYFNDTLPETLMALIREGRLDILTQKELAFVREGSFIKVSLLPHFIPKKTMRKAFYASANKKGMYLDDYSMFLTGSPCALALGKSTDARIIKHLKENSIDGKVYLSSDASNQWLRSLTYRRNISLRGLVSMYGFELVDKGFSKRHPELLTSYKDVPIDRNRFSTTQEEKITILNRIKTLTGRNSRKSRTTNTPERNQNLVDELKRLYDYRCQLCGEDSAIPQIIKANGEPFVTVHHFKGLAKVSDNTDPHAEILDRAENILVCCQHHHTYLEKHGGGFCKAFKDKNGIVWLQNKAGEKIKLALNYHFMKDHGTEHGLSNVITEKEVV